MSTRTRFLLAFAIGVVSGLLVREAVVDRAGATAAPSAPAVSAAPPDTPVRGVAALGRLEPRDGVIHVAGPSDQSVVISRLLVDKGDVVAAGDLIAVLDKAAVREATVARLEAELAHARRERDRFRRLKTQSVVSDSENDARELAVQVASAALQEARAELARAHVYAPIDGRVLAVHAREGERVGLEGILDLGRTHEMFAVAEVYESEIGRVKVGQRALVTSPALAEPLAGTVEWIRLHVGKLDVLGTDPAARKDARVVEVEIRLDDGEQAAVLTNLQVEVEILPAS